MERLDPAVEAHFRRYDTDGNNQLDFQEFSQLLTRLGLRRGTDVMRRLFDAIDSDGNGRISVAELRRWWASGPPHT